MFIKDTLSVNLENEEGEYRYSYRLTESKFEGEPVFGIEVERQDIVKGKLRRIEREYVEVISTSEEETREIIKILFKNEVSPIHFIDITGEYIDKCAENFNIKESLEFIYN